MILKTEKPVPNYQSENNGSQDYQRNIQESFNGLVQVHPKNLAEGGTM